ncbi:MAG: PAS domain S-box protein [Alphaproteobacteria bacterium]|nr:PAS domain S-box protein [Alphaproteobacteria bacterium]
MAEDGSKLGPQTPQRDDPASEAEAALARERAAHRQTEAALKLTEQRLSSLLAAGSDWLWETDIENRFTMIMGAGLPDDRDHDQLLGVGRYDLAADRDDEEKWQVHLADMEARKPFRDFTYLANVPDLGIRHVLTSGAPVYDGDGRFTGYRGTATDVTDTITARQQLQEMGTILQNTFNHMEQGLAVFGPDQRLVVRNDRFDRLLALPEGGLVPDQTPYADAIRFVAAVVRAGDDGGRRNGLVIRKRLLDHAAAGIADRFEVKIADSGWLQINVNPIAQSGLVITVTDVTPLKQAEAQQRRLRKEMTRARRQLRDAIEAISEGFILFDAEDRLVMFNQRYRDEFSYAPEALVPGVTYAEILRRGVADDSVPQGYDIDTWVKERVAAHRNPPPPYLVERSDDRWTLMTEHRTREGGIVGIRTDVTELKLSEQNAQASERLLRELVDEVPATIHTKDRKMRYDLVNRYFLEIWDLQRTDVVGKTQEEVFQDDLEPAYGQQATDRDYWVLEQRKPTGYYEVSYPRADGRTMTLWAQKIPLLDENGDVDRILSVGIDISDLKSAQAQIEKQQETLHQSEKLTALGSLLAGVAHELNNPLSVVVGQTALLEEQVNDSAIAASVAKVRAAAERCGRIVKTFLAMARQRTPVRQKVQLNQTIEDALQLLAYGLRSGGVEIERDLAEDLPPVSGDPDELTQVFTNLLVNAEQALSGNETERRITVRTRSTGGHSVVADIIDTGPGIPDDVRDRIFEPFFTTKPTGVGTGIGLSVCHGIVLAHGGTIDVMSRPEGTTFCLQLPIDTSPADEEAPADEPAVKPDARRILVVDDEEDVADLMAEILESVGHDIEVAHGGLAGLKALGERDFDLIISDLRMPDLDGRALWERAETLKPGLSRRFLFLTGDILSPMARTFLVEGARPYLEKPIMPDDLRLAVAETLATLMDES